MGDLDAGLLERPADGASVTSKLCGQFVGARAFAVTLDDEFEFRVCQGLLLLFVGSDDRFFDIGQVGFVRVDRLGTVGITGVGVLASISENTVYVFRVSSQQSHQ